VIQVVAVETPGLGDRSYVATDGSVAVVKTRVSAAELDTRLAQLTSS